MEEIYYLIAFAIPCVLLSWKLPERHQLLAISIFCVLYIGFLDYESLLIIVASSLLSYFLLRRRNYIEYGTFITIILLVSLFVYYKLSTLSGTGDFLQMALPLGMSFYIFRLLHYAIETYKGTLKAPSLQDFLLYIFYLPVILVGPIIRFSDWHRETRRRRWDSEVFSLGLERILYGFVKIIVIGNYVFTLKLGAFIQSIDIHHTWIISYLECLKYAGNSYMQFAGYSDIAIGLSLLFGIRIKENFNSPFLAHNINDFWKRWHISLSEWCRDYIFMPIASYSRVPWIAIVTSMLVLGLWHEISARYVLWAIFHGLGIVIWNLYSRYVNINIHPKFAKAMKVFSIFLTVNFVIISFAWIKETSFEASINVFKILLGIE